MRSIRKRSMTLFKHKRRQNCLKQAEKLPADQRPLRILLAAHPYVIHDPYIGEPITSMLENLEVCTLYSDRFDRKLASGKKL